MLEMISYIKSIFPEEWLSVSIDNFDDFGEVGIDIDNPFNNSITLSLVILPEIIGIAILKRSEQDILIDLGGFNYSFKKEEIGLLKTFLLHFLNTGNIRLQSKLN